MDANEAKLATLNGPFFKASHDQHTFFTSANGRAIRREWSALSSGAVRGDSAFGYETPANSWLAFVKTDCKEN